MQQDKKKRRNPNRNNSTISEIPDLEKGGYLFGKTPALKYTSLNKRKKKKDFGGFLKENSSGVSAAGNLAGSTIDSLVPETSMGGGIASGAIKGASSLAALGPYGMAAGAVVGGTMGAINAKKAKQEQNNRLKDNNQILQENLLQNAGNYKHGGKLLAKSLDPISRGKLEPISDDAVEVHADEPHKTDSVELNSAFVDDSEVIDNQQRVFSDSMLAPSGKTIAKEAKKLEKQKAEDYEPRFANANKHIDSKLDELFNYQESMKTPQEKNKVSFKKGGKLIEFFTKPKLAKGGPGKPLSDESGIDESVPEGKINNIQQYKGSPMFDMSSVDLTSGTRFDMSSKDKTESISNFDNNVLGKIAVQPKSGTRKSSIDWNKGLTQAATFAPNILNSVLQKRLKSPPSPILENQLKLQRVSPDAQLAQNTRDYRQAQGQVLKNTGQASDIISGTGSLLAKKFAANNQVYGQTNQINASIQGQEAALNQGTRTRNTERTNQFRDSLNALSNKKLEMTSQNVSNLSGKILQQGAERNQIALDKQKMDTITAALGDSGVLKRVYDSDPEKYSFLKGQFKKGGKLNIKKKK